MRVALLLDSFPAVSETFILDQVSGLLRRGVEVSIFPRHPSPAGPVHAEVGELALERLIRPTARLAGGRVARLARVAAALGGGLWRRPGITLRSLDRRGGDVGAGRLRLAYEAAICGRGPGFDLQHAHFGPNGLRALELRRTGALSGPLVTTFYGWDVGLCQADPERYGRLVRPGDAILAPSDEMRSALEAALPSLRVEVHRLGVDLRRYRPGSGESGHGSGLRALSLARLVPKKGLADAIHAVAGLLEAGGKVRYRLFGAGPLAGELAALIDSLGVAGAVTLEGGVDRDRVAEELRRSDLLIAPSRSAGGDREGTPLAILEALASGVPVLATRHAGIPETVADGETGFLVEEGDVSALAERLGQLAASPSLRRAMGRAGRRFVERHHDLERQNDLLVERYRDLAGC